MVTEYKVVRGDTGETLGPWECSKMEARRRARAAIDCDRLPNGTKVLEHEVVKYTGEFEVVEQQVITWTSKALAFAEVGDVEQALEHAAYTPLYLIRDVETGNVRGVRGDRDEALATAERWSNGNAESD